MRHIILIALLSFLVGISYAQDAQLLAIRAVASNNSGIKSPVFQSKDSSLNAPTVREVLTAQKLFVVDVSDVKKTPKGDSVSFRAELRDAFKIICHDGDSAITELDWTRCLDKSCPEAGLYTVGTAAYKNLDVLIREAGKKANRGGNKSLLKIQKGRY